MLQPPADACNCIFRLLPSLLMWACDCSGNQTDWGMKIRVCTPEIQIDAEKIWGKLSPRYHIKTATHLPYFCTHLFDLIWLSNCCPEFTSSIGVFANCSFSTTRAGNLIGCPGCMIIYTGLTRNKLTRELLVQDNSDVLKVLCFCFIIMVYCIKFLSLLICSVTYLNLAIIVK